jgi:seryl-tRNA synthetase
MLNIQILRENADLVTERLKIKNFDAKDIISQILDIDNKRKANQTERDNMQNQLNNISKQIGICFKEGRKEEAEKLKNETSELKESIKTLEAAQQNFQKDLDSLLVLLPNIPHKAVQPGKSEADNVEIRSGGTIPSLSIKKPHWELISEYDIIDFELGNKITGAGFPIYKNKGAKLQRALINFFLDEAEKAGYSEVLTPLVVNEASGFGTGQLPDKEGMMYHVVADNLYLIPTAEVPITNIYRDDILEEEILPIKHMGYSACFRREAGSWGAHVRGLNRLHQFDKVEIVQIQTPEKSYQTLEEMVSHVESLLKKLDLPYRIVRLCGGDLSFASALTYDFEVFSAAQERWLEVSSVSNFESFQSNRLKLRYKSKEHKKNIIAHTLNGSALALPRIMAAIIENYQNNEGIDIPEVLIPYTGFNKIIKK